MPDPSQRKASVDVARGLAVLAMIQTHVYDGWVAPAHRHGAGWELTRWLGILPLPTFLVLAGVGLVLRVRASARREEPAGAVRRDLATRGLRVFGAGYLVSAVLGILDGADAPATYLRADVLHAIGGSLALVGASSVATRSADRERWLVRGALVVIVATVAAMMPATTFGRGLTGVVRFVLAPLVEVPGITRMPMIPLAAWLGVGMGLALTLLARERTTATYARVAIAAALLAWVANEAMHRVHAALPGPLDRLHPAAYANLVDLALRAIALVSVVHALAPMLPSRWSEELARIGRHSLLAYAVHLPFAYGRVIAAFARRMDLLEASAALVLTLAGTYAVVLLRDRHERARPSSRSSGEGGGAGGSALESGT